jgi:uncharacterized protein YijF (DUF1287 family)
MRSAIRTEWLPTETFHIPRRLGKSLVVKPIKLGNNVPHIGIVVDQRSPETGRYLVVHNIGRGPQMEGVLLRWKVTSHYRYYGPQN